ncbi:MAG: GHMP kinase [Bacteroidetes bacterium]|nr:GHMP kinase [Bacteroidota bacterium]
MSHSVLRVSTPGRVCLFGEHQDYLGLPVVPCAISVRIQIEGSARPDRQVRIDLPDIDSSMSFRLGEQLTYSGTRDYFRSSVNVLLRKGFTFSTGCDCTVRGNIPINSGTSSSSALIVSWIAFLARVSDQQKSLPPLEVATLAHEAEVLEFGEPGGMMDHFSTACGGVLAIDFHPSLKVREIPVTLGTFVLGDSQQPKDTTAILARVKLGVLRIVKNLQDRHPDFSLQTANADMLGRVARELSPAERELLDGTIRNRDITREARQLLNRPAMDHRGMGELLSQHQEILRDVLKISTPKIDGMIAAAMAAGAYGAKINGSGGGGCMFAYAPESPEIVADAIERAGGKAIVVTTDEGTRTEILQAAD